MATVETALSPAEILRRLYGRLRAAYDKLQAARPGDVEADEIIINEIEAIESLVFKLNFSFIRKLRDDAGLEKGKYEELARLEGMLDKIFRGKMDSIRSDNYLGKIARNIEKVVMREKKKSKRQGKKELTKIGREKKGLKDREKEAKEKAGRK